MKLRASTIRVPYTLKKYAGSEKYHFGYQKLLRMDQIGIHSTEQHKRNWILILNGVLKSSVADPDQYVFRPSGSGSGSFYHLAKIVRKILITNVL
jgi:hypothetical protein